MEGKASTEERTELLFSGENKTLLMDLAIMNGKLTYTSQERVSKQC
jgi:hypothetical protein